MVVPSAASRFELQAAMILGIGEGCTVVEQVMVVIPPEHLARFRESVYRLPSADTLINLKTGPMSEREKGFSSNSRPIECHSSWFAHFESDSLIRSGKGASHQN
ncbi:MAG: hypothetical protein ACHRXM_08055 [Isosphaerales bacterium]